MDIHTTALDLIRKHGDSAPIFAATEADARLESGNMDGAAHWRLVLRAIRGMVELGGTRVVLMLRRRLHHAAQGFVEGNLLAIIFRVRLVRWLLIIIAHAISYIHTARTADI